MSPVSSKEVWKVLKPLIESYDDEPPKLVWRQSLSWRLITVYVIRMPQKAGGGPLSVCWTEEQAKFIVKKLNVSGLAADMGHYFYSQSFISALKMMGGEDDDSGGTGSEENKG